MKNLIWIVAAWAGILQAAPSDTCKQETWVTNGPVHAIAQAGNTIYIGGEFTRVGPYTGGGVPIEASSGSALAKFPKVNGFICAVCPDGNGGWYIGGLFNKVDGIQLNNIAHISSNGSVDASWNPDANCIVYALTVSETTVYAGGIFTSIGGQSRNRIAALDATTGNATSWNPDANWYVNALAASGTTVYTGGLFTSIGGQPRNRIAALDALTGNATSWNPDANWDVYALAVCGTTVYAGGYFPSIGQGIGHSYFAQFGDFNPDPIMSPVKQYSAFSFSVAGLDGRLLYVLPKPNHVSLRIYSINGRLIQEPVNMWQKAGYYSISMTPMAAAGAYLAVFKAGSYYQRKLINMMR